MKKIPTKRIKFNEVVVFKTWEDREFHVYVSSVGTLVIDSNQSLWIRPISKTKIEIRTVGQLKFRTAQTDI